MKPTAILVLVLAACTPEPGDTTGTDPSTGADSTLSASETAAAPTTSSASSASTGSSGATADNSGSSSTGEPHGFLYDPCDEAADCDPEVADGCAEGPVDGAGFCSALCELDDTCPADDSGLGTPTCIPRIFDAPAACALLCDDGQCPPDLECLFFKGIQVCM